MSQSIHRRILPAPVGSGARSLKIRRSSKQHSSRRISDKNRSKSVRILERSSSEPNLCRLFRSSGDGADDDRRWRQPMSGSDRIAYLPQIRSEVFASSPSLSGYPSPSSPSPMNHGGLNKEAKVVISVYVEGSPGPVRTMVKLGCNVGETIKLVVGKYSEEGRTPKLDKDDAFELHHSHFSLQCLDKTEIMGEVGGRSFYLRKRVPDDNVPKPCMSEIGPNLPSSNMIQSFIVRKMGKIIRRTRRIWNILVCMR